ncbi:MAG TPA: tlde1 domain-containing protein, partial [Bryobacteraceae bacterium]|nr:tlde1 domain-containing protein [Bryobacteraceae bacterium]
MWTYRQSTGEMSRDGIAAGIGYSGFEAGKNNPAMQEVEETGPIPQGRYTIGEPEDLEGGPHGPFILRLTPDSGNQMFGRSGFLIHGDSIAQPGMASRGC